MPEEHENESSLPEQDRETAFQKLASKIGEYIDGNDPKKLEARVNNRILRANYIISKKNEKILKQNVQSQDSTQTPGASEKDTTLQNTNIQNTLNSVPSQEEIGPQVSSQTEPKISISFYDHPIDLMTSHQTIEQAVQGYFGIISKIKKETNEQTKEVKDKSISIRIGFDTYQDAHRVRGNLEYIRTPEKDSIGHAYTLREEKIPGQNTTILVLTSNNPETIKKLSESSDPKIYSEDKALENLHANVDKIKLKGRNIIYRSGKKEGQILTNNYKLLLRDKNPILLQSLCNDKNRKYASMSKEQKTNFFTSINRRIFFKEMIEQLPGFSAVDGDYAEKSTKNSKTTGFKIEDENNKDKNYLLRKEKLDYIRDKVAEALDRNYTKILKTGFTYKEDNTKNREDFFKREKPNIEKILEDNLYQKRKPLDVRSAAKLLVQTLIGKNPRKRNNIVKEIRQSIVKSDKGFTW